MPLIEGRTFIGRLSHGADLLAALNEFCQEKDIRLGALSVIGAVTGGRLGFYNQNTKKYIESLRLDERLEIVSCQGNISLKERVPFVHAHVILANDKGETFSGHLVPGCTLFAAEYIIKEYTGGELARDFDAQTGLFLWSGGDNGDSPGTKQGDRHGVPEDSDC